MLCSERTAKLLLVQRHELMKRPFALLFLLAFLLPACGNPLNDLGEAGPSFDTLTIGYAEPISDYSPLSYNATNRKYLSNLYEPLVRFDGTFNTDSALAVSWGRLDDTTWDFQLRQSVKFHTGQEFTAADALYSLVLAKTEGDSELGALLSTISAVEKTGEYRLSITTTKPDPLLLNRLSFVYMVPQDYTNFDLPVGTGPYRVSSFSKDALNLERFDDYWGPLAYFPFASLRYVPDPEQRRDEFLDEALKVLANVPPQDVNELKDSGLELVDFPSLEVSYLMLGRTGVFADSNLREAVWYALSTSYAEDLGSGFLQSANQYAASGIFGYSAEQEEREQDLIVAERFRALVPGEVSVTLDVPYGLEVLGDAIAEDLSSIDVSVTVNAMSAADLDDKIQASQSDFYFFGWKYELADAADFYESIVHSKTEGYGQFNGLDYADDTLDAWIEEAGTSLSVEERRTLLQSISDRLLEDKSILPLFEAKTLYGLQPGLYWNLRLDGQLWASEIIESVVK